MKTALRIVFALALVLGLFAGRSAYAAIGQVNNLNNSGSSVICVPAASDQIIVIQNNGNGNVRLSLDGGAGYTDVNTGNTGTNPTPTKGLLLLAGQQLILTTPPYISNQTGQGYHKPIVAILTSSTTTVIDIVTDSTLTQFPTT